MTRPSLTLIAKCVGCGKKREIKPREVLPGDQPMCDECYMPMLAESVKTK